MAFRVIDSETGKIIMDAGDIASLIATIEEMDKTNLQVEINGKLYTALVTAKPLYDANGGKMRS